MILVPLQLPFCAPNVWILQRVPKGALLAHPVGPASNAVVKTRAKFASSCNGSADIRNRSLLIHA
jgi:hypothetical protein